MADDALNGSWSAPNTERPPRMPNTVFCVCVVCQVPNTCETYEKIDGRMYCPACAAKQRG